MPPRSPAHRRAIAVGARLAERSVRARRRYQHAVRALVENGHRALLVPDVHPAAIERALDQIGVTCSAAAFAKYAQRNRDWLRAALAPTPNNDEAAAP